MTLIDEFITLIMWAALQHAAVVATLLMVATSCIWLGFSVARMTRQRAICRAEGNHVWTTVPNVGNYGYILQCARCGTGVK